MESKCNEKAVRKIRVRWSLRTLLIVVAMCGVIVNFLVRHGYEKYRRMQIEADWQAAGATVIFQDGTGGTMLIADRGRLGFDVASLRNISSLPQLEHLVLCATAVSDEELRYLNDLPDLKSLALNDTMITDVGVENLSPLTSLQHLHLENTRITDKSVRILEAMHGLKTLDVRGTLISKSGSHRLKNALKNTEVLCNSRTHVEVADEHAEHAEQELFPQDE